MRNLRKVAIVLAFVLGMKKDEGSVQSKGVL